MASKLIQKIAQKVTVDYCHLSIVENLDGFLLQDVVRNLLFQECGIEVVVGNNLNLRIHYELQYKLEKDRRFIYVCDSISTILADMKRDAFICDFSVSDVFPLVADKSLVRKQSYEVLDILFEKVSTRKISMSECSSIISSIKSEIEDRKRRSAEFFLAQITNIDINWNSPAQTISLLSGVLAQAIREGVYQGVAQAIDAVNGTFQKWIDEEYFAMLHSNPLNQAKSVNNILPHLSMNHSKDEKIALFVVDGFSYWQYSILRPFIKDAGLKLMDGSTLAWMPSITMLSRQAIFRGSDPLQDYKQNPENEKKLWIDYWKNQGLGNYEIQYLYDTDEFAINDGVKRLAVVTVEMDEKMHSSTDYKDLCSLTENWCSRILEKIKTIVDDGFTLYLTTDHGSVLSQGWRTLSPAEKVFLYKDGSRGTRHLIYNNKEEQESFFISNSDLSMIKHDNWMSIRDTRCFARENTNMITHGGSHFMEMMVPFIKIVR